MAGNERYQELYADDHTFESLAATAAQFRGAGCAPLCTRLDLQPADSDSTPAGPKVRLRGVLGESPVDRDGDGFYDTLDVDVALAVRTPGDYWLEGSLHAKGVAEPAIARYFSNYFEPLCSGVYTVTLHFKGEDLNAMGADGPYTLTLAVHSGWLSPPEDTANDTYVTAPYTRYQFAGGYHIPPTATSRTLLFVFGRCAHPKQPSRNDNERYDRLEISAGVPGLDLPGGEYDWQGSLFAPGGEVIDTAAGGGQIAPDGTIDLTFSGAAIRASNVDGPYTLGDVTITSRTAPSTTVTLSQLCVTEELLAWQFE